MRSVTISLILLAFLALLACILPYTGQRLFRALDVRLDALAERPAIAISLVGLLTLLLNALAAWLYGMPEPYFHDEFSYLLAADTFRHFRLTNPPHPYWQFFDTMHVLQHPTYAAKYPPAQGMSIALGTVLTGLPVVGVWLASAAACAALCWMFFIWLPPRWAVVGGLLAALHPGILLWSQSFWGGAIAMGGGAVLCGAFRLLSEEPRSRPAALFGAGMAVLLLSRPFEGCVLCLLLLLCLARNWRRDGLLNAAVLKKTVAPPALILSLTLAFLGYYNYRITGHPQTMPYAAHERQYSVAPLFWFLRVRPEPAYTSDRLRDLYTRWSLEEYRNHATPKRLLHEILDKSRRMWKWFFLPAPLLLALVGLPVALRGDRWMRLAVGVLIIFYILILTETWLNPHYIAPIIGLVLVLLMSGLRQVGVWQWHGRPAGRLFVRGSVIALLAACLVTAHFSLRNHLAGFALERAGIVQRLQADGPPQLVFVRYDSHYSLHQEWVYNEADIDRARTVWARDRGPEENSRLIAYYPDRKVWFLRLSPGNTVLQEYAAVPAPNGP